MAKLGFKIQYSNRVFKQLKKELKTEILQSAKASPELRADIRRVFQQANRRIQNIEKANLLSPAVAALNKGDIKGYTKFSMRGEWEDLKKEYAKAVSFLRQPTSSASGTREYNKHLQQHYGLTDKEFNLMAQNLNDKLQSLSDTDFVEKYLMRYKDFTGELEQTARDVSGQIEDDAYLIQRELEQSLETSADNVSSEATQKIIDLFKDFGL